MQSLTNNKVIFIICGVLWVIVVARVMLNVKGTDALQPTLPQSQVEALAREQLGALQQPSFTGNQELCGIIFETSERTLGVSRPREGEEATCDLAYFDEPGMVPVASFHTHGKYSPDYDGEVPSLLDMQSDIASGIDGYISTPGGRLWHIDHQARIARQVCGENCLSQDPGYVPDPFDSIPPSFTVGELAARFGEGNLIIEQR